jgi:hypothetical protein
MIDLGSIRGLHEHRHELRAFCPRCRRWSALDLAALVDAGFGDRRLPLSTRCTDCGSRGELQVRPPMPTRDPSTGWLSPGSVQA